MSVGVMDSPVDTLKAINSHKRQLLNAGFYLAIINHEIKLIFMEHRVV